MVSYPAPMPLPHVDEPCTLGRKRARVSEHTSPRNRGGGGDSRDAQLLIWMRLSPVSSPRARLSASPGYGHARLACHHCFSVLVASFASLPFFVRMNSSRRPRRQAGWQCFRCTCTRISASRDAHPLRAPSPEMDESGRAGGRQVDGSTGRAARRVPLRHTKDSFQQGPLLPLSCRASRQGGADSGISVAFGRGSVIVHQARASVGACAMGDVTEALLEIRADAVRLMEDALSCVTNASTGAKTCKHVPSTAPVPFSVQAHV